jgi:non-lysosomal glucosylceramidase
MKRRDFLKASALSSSLFGFLQKQPTVPSSFQAARTTPEQQMTTVPLSSLRFKASGIVRREMQFKYFSQPLAYAEDFDRWHTGRETQYLYQIDAGAKSAPPVGMRSAVPLGGLGAGTVELRADGSLRDWEIFNNSPAGGTKIQIDDAFWGLWARPHGQPSIALTLRTHPPRALPPVSQIEYAGAFPVSRLRFSHPGLPLGVELYACSELHPFDAEASGTPCAIFTFSLHNSAREPVETSLLFTMPNYIGGQVSAGRRLLFKKGGLEATSGTLVTKVVGERLQITGAAAPDQTTLWNEFSSAGNFGRGAVTDRVAKFGALAAATTLDPHELRTITFILAWHFPNRPYKSQVPGNRYTIRYRDADDVADQAAGRLDATWASISIWQQTLFRNSLPDWLQDALINSVATMYKTGLWFRDGRWRQWESFSCAGLNPGHIDFYRILPYAFLFPSLHKQLFHAHAESQKPDGFIPEQLTTGCSVPVSELGHAGGRVMGDSETVFILWAWQIYSWTGDRDFLDLHWPKVKRAAEWQIERSARYGLPERLQNTYDWWQFDKKYLVAYNAFLHLAAMLAAEKLAQVENEAELANQYRQAFGAGQQSLYKRLWTGRHFRAWWMEGESYPDALHADTLYGQLWAFLLDLGLTTEESRLKQHLHMESSMNSTPFGLRVMSGARHQESESPIGPHAARDNLIWQAGSLDWCSLSLSLGEPVKQSMDEARKIVLNWTDRLCDEWDYTDLTAEWDGAIWCNSHYSRQVILWSIPLALSGQRYFAPASRLTFDPRIASPAKLPFFTPTAFGTLHLLKGGHYELTVDFGVLKLRELRVAKALLRRSISLHAGESVTLHAE